MDVSDDQTATKCGRRWQKLPAHKLRTKRKFDTRTTNRRADIQVTLLNLHSRHWHNCKFFCFGKITEIRWGRKEKGSPTITKKKLTLSPILTLLNKKGATSQIRRVLFGNFLHKNTGNRQNFRECTNFPPGTKQIPGPFLLDSSPDFLLSRRFIPHSARFTSKGGNPEVSK